MPVTPRLSLAGLLIVAAGALALDARPVCAQSSAWGPNGYISVNGMFETTTRSNDIVTRQDINQETTSITTTQETGRRPVYDITVGGRLRGNFGLGFGLTVGPASDDATVTGDIPHPFYFDRPRRLEASTSLHRTDLMVHIHPMWLIPLSSNVHATVFGGATWFQIRQQTVQSVTVGDRYPFDDVSLAGVERERQTRSRWGVNAGFDVSYFFSRHVGIQGLVRYTNGEVTVTTGGADSDIAVGGLHAGAGLRIRY